MISETMEKSKFLAISLKSKKVFLVLIVLCQIFKLLPFFFIFVPSYYFTFVSFGFLFLYFNAAASAAGNQVLFGWGFPFFLVTITWFH